MGGLDLTGVRRVIDDILATSAVKITRDNGTADAVLDTATGLLEDPDPAGVYDGPGVVQPISSGQWPHVPDPNIAQTPAASGATYRALIPLSEDVDYLVGDIVEQTAVDPKMGDESILGRRFKIVEGRGGAQSGFAAVRIIYLQPVS